MSGTRNVLASALLKEKYKKEKEALSIKTVLLYAEIRGEFERYLTSYVETRTVFEEKLDQVPNLLNMLTLMESEPGDVKPKLKEKIKELL